MNAIHQQEVVSTRSAARASWDKDEGMRAPWVLSSAIVLALCACSTERRAEVRTETTHLLAGGSIPVDSTLAGSPQMSVPENGFLLSRLEVWPEHPHITDVAGIRKVYIFLPDRFVAAAKRGPIALTHNDGLRVLEYSKNDAFSDGFCAQELSIGSLSAHVIHGQIEISGHVASAPVSGTKDGRCEPGQLAGSLSFPI